MTQFALKTEPPKNIPLVVVVFQEEKKTVWGRRSRSYPQEILSTAREDGFQGHAGTVSGVVRPPQGRPAERLLLLSAGKAAEANLQTLRKLAAATVKWAADAKIPSLTFLVPDQIASPAEEAQALVEGFLLGAYRFQRHKSQEETFHVPKEVFLVADQDKDVREAVRRGEIFSRSANFARDLINEPPSRKTPETLGKIAQSLSGRGVSVRVFHKTQIKAMKMDALLGVNRGSAHPPVLVHFHYKPKGKPRKRLAFVGKGITFDSGGLSLKPADGMMTMKYDMAGAAIVFALFNALKQIQPPVEVHGVTPITENMPGQDAYKPGDVVRAANGKTIEVLNTDAEGRVVLADGLSYASRLNVEEIIDMATLTGAATIALGKAYAALMSNNSDLADRLRKISEKSGEKIWPLPLEDSYKEHIKSKVADLKNIGNPGEAGTIIGGLFLQEFVDGKPWAHLDIASCGWSGDGSVWGAPGATGAMVRTMLHYILAN